MTILEHAKLIQQANPGLSFSRAKQFALFWKETEKRLIDHYGDMETAMADPGKSWEQVKKELGID